MYNAEDLCRIAKLFNDGVLSVEAAKKLLKMGYTLNCHNGQVIEIKLVEVKRC